MAASSAKGVLYHSPRSRSTRVVWMLEELGSDVWKNILTIQTIHVSKGENKRPEYLAISPSGKVPAYVEGDFVLTESGAIINYLLNKFGCEDRLIPKEPRARARYDQWLLFTVGHLDPTLVPALNHVHHTPRENQDKVMLAHKRREFEEICLPAIERALPEFGVGFINGDTFTAADIVVTYSLRMAKVLGWLEGHKNVLNYFSRIAARPAYLKVFY